MGLRLGEHEPDFPSFDLSHFLKIHSYLERLYQGWDQEAAEAVIAEFCNLPHHDGSLSLIANFRTSFYTDGRVEFSAEDENWSDEDKSVLFGNFKVFQTVGFLKSNIPYQAIIFARKEFFYPKEANLLNPDPKIFYLLYNDEDKKPLSFYEIKTKEMGKSEVNSISVSSRTYSHLELIYEDEDQSRIYVWTKIFRYEAPLMKSLFMAFVAFGFSRATLLIADISINFFFDVFILLSLGFLGARVIKYLRKYGLKLYWAAIYIL
jgi:hypothetical protein